MQKLLCPSMMCADFSNLSKEIVELNKANVDIFHCDIMDGNYVQNITMGLNDVRTVKKYTEKLVDCHLMIENPGEKVDWFIEAGADIIYIHPETEKFVIKTLNHIRSRGKKSGLAVNPDLSLGSIQELFPYCDYILVMTVNPGFAGQTFIESTIDKIRALIQLKKQYQFKLLIDGACSPEVIKKYSHLGVDGFILGTSALFNKEQTYAEIVKELRVL